MQGTLSTIKFKLTSTYQTSNIESLWITYKNTKFATFISCSLWKSHSITFKSTSHLYCNASMIWILQEFHDVTKFEELTISLSFTDRSTIAIVSWLIPFSDYFTIVTCYYVTLITLLPPLSYFIYPLCQKEYLWAVCVILAHTISTPHGVPSAVGRNEPSQLPPTEHSSLWQLTYHWRRAHKYINWHIRGLWNV